MALNTITSRSAAVSGEAGTAGTGAFTIIFSSNKHKTNGGVAMYVKFTTGASTSLTLTPKVVNDKISADDQYQFLTGVNGTFGAGEAAKITASGNYRIKLPVMPNEKSIVVGAAFAGGTSGVAVIDFCEEGEN